MSNLPPELLPYTLLIHRFLDYRAVGDGYWVYLRKGYWLPEIQLHCLSAKSLEECARKLETVVPCPCCGA
jgi:hypothetical protein